MRLSAPIHRLKRAAKLQAREQSIPLHRALDQIATTQGFPSWSLLASRHADASSTPAGLLAQLRQGELFLIAARPHQGKTLLALQMAAASAEAGRAAYFFSLDFTLADAQAKLKTIGADPGRLSGKFVIDCSDDICADHIMLTLSDAPKGTFAVIDYLQLIDQKRSTPPLQQQVADLAHFVRSRGLIVAFICQIDRAFETAGAAVPGPADIRLPNPLDLSLFSRAWFLHQGVLHSHDNLAG